MTLQPKFLLVHRATTSAFFIYFTKIQVCNLGHHFLYQSSNLPHKKEEWSSVTPLVHPLGSLIVFVFL